MKNFGNPNQLDAFRDVPPPMPERDSHGRTRQDIEKATKSLKREVLDSIIFKDGKFFVEGKDADEWIAEDERLNSSEVSRDRYWDR